MSALEVEAQTRHYCRGAPPERLGMKNLPAGGTSRAHAVLKINTYSIGGKCLRRQLEAFLRAGRSRGQDDSTLLLP